MTLLYYRFMKKTELDEATIRSLYRPRVADPEIKKMLEVFGAVHISGCKWCGKTWTGIAHSNSSILIGKRKIRELAEADPEVALEGEEPRLVDEWQDVPELWDTARYNIDFSSRKGMYIFTGSVSPPKESTKHSGTGRFAPLKMRPMSLFESGDSNGSVSLAKLFRGEKLTSSVSKIGYKETVNLICRGGWPAGIELDTDKAMLIPRGYVDMIINYDFSKIDGVKRNPSTVRRILRSLARNNATEARISVLANDIKDADKAMSVITAEAYLNALKGIFVIEEQDGWVPEIRSKIRMRTSPKRHFVDPSLAAAALGISSDALLMDAETAGFMYESLCYRDLCTYAAPFSGKVYHYRDDNGLEVDAIIETADGRWAGVEMKMGYSKVEEGAKNLISLRDKIRRENEEGKKKVPDPEFLMVLCATVTSSHVRKQDGVLVVPTDCLGP